jgi:hypothetical protein
MELPAIGGDLTWSEGKGISQIQFAVQLNLTALKFTFIKYFNHHTVATLLVTTTNYLLTHKNMRVVTHYSYLCV